LGEEIVSSGFGVVGVEVERVMLPSTSLQCFDTVGWAAGRASGL